MNSSIIFREYYVALNEHSKIFDTQQIWPNSTLNNNTLTIRFQEEINFLRVKEVLGQLIKRHESLRTVFFKLENGTVAQEIVGGIKVNLSYFEENLENLNLLSDKIRKPFQLDMPPLIRCVIVKSTSVNESMVIFDLHGIIADDLSRHILAREFITLYYESKLPELSLNYKDFTNWLNNFKESSDYKKQKKYWVMRLEEANFRIDFPLSKLQSPNSQISTKTYDFKLDSELYERLKNFTTQEKIDLHIGILGIYILFLSKISGQNEVIVGINVSGRTKSEFQNLVGIFKSILPFRIYIDSKQDLPSFFKMIKDNFYQDHLNQDYRFEDYERVPEINSKLKSDYFCETHFSFVNEKDSTPDSGNIQINNPDSTKSKLKLLARSCANQLHFKFLYDNTLFEEEILSRFSNYFLALITNLLENSKNSIKDYSLLTKLEEKQLIKGFNAVEGFMPDKLNFIQLFEIQAKNTPNAIAVSYGNTQITYNELNSYANQLARILQQNGFQRGHLAALALDRSIDMVTSILAIWKLGGAYLPLSLQDPMSRMIDIIKQSSTYISILPTKNIVSISELPQHKWLYLDKVNYKNSSYPCTNLNLDFSQDDLAYVIYTSGSTGAPKGAMITQKGMLNHIYAKIEDLEIACTSVVSQNAPHTFDISIWQFFASLLVGGRIYIYSNELILNIEEFLSTLMKDKVSILEVVPSYLSLLLETPSIGYYLKNLQFLIVTGEEVKPNLVNRWFDFYPEVPVVNAYGPTEASDDITHHIIKEPIQGIRVPIGRPIRNMKLYVLDSFDKICPIGIKGEICVMGIGVGYGYLNDSNRTNEVFVSNPFNTYDIFKMYRTGDLGYWLPNGTLIFLGRKDNQVKLYGHRIELGEIEYQIMRYPGIEQCTVMIDKKNNSSLYSFYVSKEPINEDELKKYLSTNLPNYMVPHFIIKLPKMPLTKNGKINRKALPFNKFL